MPLLERTFPAELSRSADAVSFARDGAEGAGIGEEKLLAVELAVEEAVTNVCRHAYRGAPGEVTLRLLESDGGIVIEVEDAGPPFDPLARPDPDVTLSIEERGIGGLGIFLIRKVTDGVAWRFENGRNVLAMTVHR